MTDEVSADLGNTSSAANAVPLPVPGEGFAEGLNPFPTVECLGGRFVNRPYIPSVIARAAGPWQSVPYENGKDVFSACGN